MRPAIILLALAAVLAPRPARADTPQQVQKAIQAVCDRASAAYEHGDTGGYMAHFAPQLIETTVVGKQANLRQTRAFTDAQFTNEENPYSLRQIVRRVTMQRNKAQTVQEWHYICKHPGTPGNVAFTYKRDIVKQVTWIKGEQGWHELVETWISDVTTYSR